jgi:hypothetical protein
MLRLGFEEADLRRRRSASGSATRSSSGATRTRSGTRRQAHLDAGADHVCIQTLPSGVLDLDALGRLAPVLLEL